MAILKPMPGSPSRLALGMRQSSKIRYEVEDARMPSLSSFLPRLNPGASVGTMKALQGRAVWKERTGQSVRLVAKSVAKTVRVRRAMLHMSLSPG